MDTSWFRDLAHLARTGNFSQAAGLSNLSQPALSRRIKALEAWVGVGLVDRSTQPVRLTFAGVQMLEAGQQAVALIEAERGQVREAQSLPDRYVVTFATQHSIGWRFYPAWLQDFEAAFGPILSRLRADDLPNCMADLRAGTVDFVIAYETGSPQRTKQASDTIVIGRDSLVPVCKPDANGHPMFDLECSTGPVPYLKFGDEAPISSHLEPLLTSTDLGARLHTVYENAMAGALRIRVRDGAGVAWLPHSLVSPDLDAGYLVETGAQAWSVELNITLFRLPHHANHLTQNIWSFLNTQDMEKPGPDVMPAVAQGEKV